MYATVIKCEGNKGPTMYGAEEIFLRFFSSCFFGKIMYYVRPQLLALVGLDEIFSANVR